MTDLERRQLVVGLKTLYAQNLEYLKSVENNKFKKRNDELSEYITQIENGADYTRSLKEWCNLFGDILVKGG